MSERTASSPARPTRSSSWPASTRIRVESRGRLGVGIEAGAAAVGEPAGVGPSTSPLGANGLGRVPAGLRGRDDGRRGRLGQRRRRRDRGRSLDRRGRGRGGRRAAAALDRDRAVVGEEQEDVVEPLAGRVGVDLDRPGEVAPLGVDLVERRDHLGVGLHARRAEVAELVEHAERVHAAAEHVRPGPEGDPVPARPLVDRAVDRLGRGLLRARDRGFGRLLRLRGLLGRTAGAGAAVRRAAAGASRRSSGSRSRRLEPADEIGRRGDRRARRLGLDGGREVVARVEQGRDDVRVDRQRARADPVEDRLDPVRELGQGTQADHGGGALDAVGGPEGPVEVARSPCRRSRSISPSSRLSRSSRASSKNICRNLSSATPKASALSTLRHGAFTEEFSSIDAATLPRRRPRVLPRLPGPKSLIKLHRGSDRRTQRRSWSGSAGLVIQPVTD